MNEYELFLYETSIEKLNLRSTRERLFESLDREARRQRRQDRKSKEIES